VIPLLFGLQRVSPNVIWTGNWLASPVNAGKGNKGKSGTQQYNYSCAMGFGIAQGPLGGVYSIWQDRDKFNLAYATESYTIPGGGGSYTVQHGGNGNPSWWGLNVGVARQDSLTFTANDYGSPGSVTTTTNILTPMKLVSTTPSVAGTYTMHFDSTGYTQYIFCAADGGKTVQITYSYQLNNFSVTGTPMTHLDLVLFPGQQGQAPWNTLAIYSPRTAALSTLGYSELGYVGTMLIQLGSSGVAPSLNFEALGRCSWGGAVTDCNPADILSNILTSPLDGVLGWAASPSSAPIYGPVNVSGLCTTNGHNITATSGVFTGIPTGSQITIAGVSYPISTIPTSTTATLFEDAGINTTPVAWNAIAIQSFNQTSGSAVWLPSGSATFGLGASSELYTYCAANGLFVSLYLDQEQDSRKTINELLQVANADVFWSEGLVKFRSYGDTSKAGNGFLYTPNTQPIYDITDDDYICDPGQEPLRLTQPDIRDVNNSISIEWLNRSADYAQSTLPPEEDLSSILTYGRRPAPNTSLHSICQQSVAVQVANTLLKRSVYIDGGSNYEFTLGPQFALLDPMDIITLTDPYLGLSKAPVRITSIEEDEKGRLKIKAEDFPWSCSAPTLYAKQVGTATSSGFFVDPGVVNTPMFVPLPTSITQGNPYVLGIALSGGPNWGGAAVFVSTDGGNSYQQAGITTGPSNMGVTTAILPAHSDPDSTNTLSVATAMSYGALDSYSQVQADAFVPLIAVENELLAYETATLTGSFAYGLTYLRRGAYESQISTHASGVLFCQVNDGNLFNWNYTEAEVATTVYFKFCSLNKAGARQQDISQVTAYPFFIPAPRAPWRWNAGYAAPIMSGGNIVDALATSENFGQTVAYVTAENGTPLPTITIYGNPPINIFSSSVGAPVIEAISVINSGGSLTGPATFIIGINCFDAAPNAGISRLSNLFQVSIPSGSSQKLHITVSWPNGSFGGQVFVASTNTDLGLHYETSFDSGVSTSGVVSYDLTSVSGLYFGPSDEQFHNLLFKVRREFVSGVWAQVASAVTHVDSTHGIISLGAGGGVANDSVNRIISKLATAVGTSPIAQQILPSFTVTSNDTAGNYTVTPDPTAFNCQLGDLFTLRTGGTGTTSGYSDALFSNFYSSGLAAHKNSGNLAAVIGGKGAFQPFVTVVDNTSTGFTVSPPWQIVPDSTSAVVLLESLPQVVLPSDGQQLSSYANWQSICGQLPVPNYSGQVVRIEAYTSNFDNSTGPEEFVAFSEQYIWGAQGTRYVIANTSQLITDGIISCDTSVITGYSDVLNGNITSGATTLVPTTDTQGVNGTFFAIGSETLKLVSGAGTGTWTVLRGQQGSTAASHANGATISLPGALTVTLLAISSVPNISLLIVKTSADINYVKVLPDTGVGDTLPDGSSSAILSDNSAANGTYGIKAPGA
jgi:hypothetical protein